jgi:hypothetical protein
LLSSLSAHSANLLSVAEANTFATDAADFADNLRKVDLDFLAYCNYRRLIESKSFMLKESYVMRDGKLSKVMRRLPNQGLHDLASVQCTYSEILAEVSKQQPIVRHNSLLKAISVASSLILRSNREDKGGRRRRKGKHTRTVLNAGCLSEA